MPSPLSKIDSRLKVMAGVVVLLAMYWAYQWLGTATIEITSAPVGAVVKVNGQQRGVTPTGSIEVDAGEQGITITHSHYEPQRLSLALRRGDHEQRHISFQPGTAILELLSNPRGAWVEVDGQRLPDVTPTKLDTASGEHEIRMGLAERHIVAKSITAKHGDSVEVNFDLNIDPHGSLTLTTQPGNARVAFLDADLEYTPNMRLPIGEYALRVTRTGYVAQEFRYRVNYGDNQHHVKLKRGYGQLTVKVQPADAEVTVFYSQGDGQRRQAYQPAMQVPVGQVRVRARAMGRRTVQRRLEVGLSGASVNITLVRFKIADGTEIQDSLAIGGLAPTMIVVPPGSFVMGDDAGSYSEKPSRRIVLTQPFAVAKTELTIADYLKFSEASGVALPAKLDAKNPQVALGYVTYQEAHRYAQWLSEQTGEHYRLPSEAEWEYVARAGSQADYGFGDDPLDICKFGNVADLAIQIKFRDWEVVECDDGMERVGQVGQLAANAFGLQDVYGNVAEWVSDCGMPSYEGAPTDGSPTKEGANCNSHGYRGGSWDSSAAEAKSAYRNSSSSAADDRGIRLVREL